MKKAAPAATAAPPAATAAPPAAIAAPVSKGQGGGWGQLSPLPPWVRRLWLHFFNKLGRPEFVISRCFERARHFHLFASGYIQDNVDLFLMNHPDALVIVSKLRELNR